MNMHARVIAQGKGSYRVASEYGEKQAEVSGKYRFNAKTVSDYPTVGDYVTVSWPEGDNSAVIHLLEPRKSCFIRKAAGNGKQEQVVAANIDTVFLCMSLNQNYNLRRLERYLAIAWESGATPVVVLTKADLCADVEEKRHEVENVALGAEILVVSSYLNDFDSVQKYVQSDKTIAFLGSSGVGKSTLINKLIGEDRIETSAIGNDDKGHHTTTRRELITLANGAAVIDTPGMRELGMWDSEEGIRSAFSDIDELAAQCRFADCSHLREPGCAVRRALQDGTLDQARWESYLKLKIENEIAAEGSQYLVSKRAKFKEIAKINKERKKM